MQLFYSFVNLGYTYSMENLGLARGAVKLVPHDPVWHELFTAEASVLSQKLGVDVSSIHHVGSTAIPGIVAKPILDIAVSVDSTDIADRWAAHLAEIGYWDKGKEPEMPDRRFFAKGPEDNRTVYLHVVTPKEFDRLIKFRNALQANPELARQYAQLKQKLAAENSSSRAAYTTAKSVFIQSVLG